MVTTALPLPLLPKARPVAKMILLLEENFSKGSASTQGGDLSLRFGQEGSKLSHSHSTQYTFVLQSLSLWKMASNTDSPNHFGFRILENTDGVRRQPFKRTPSLSSRGQ